MVVGLLILERDRVGGHRGEIDRGDRPSERNHFHEPAFGIVTHGQSLQLAAGRETSRGFVGEMPGRRRVSAGVRSKILLVEAVVVPGSTVRDPADPPGPLGIDQGAEHPEGARKPDFQDRVSFELDPQPAVVVVGLDPGRAKTPVKGPPGDNEKPLPPRSVETAGPGPETPGNPPPLIPGLCRHTV